MNHRKRIVSIMTTVSMAGLLVACGTRQPPPDFNAPPTEREMALLGVDATDNYFLNRFRRCVQWKAEQTCRKEPYGDDEGSFH